MRGYKSITIEWSYPVEFSNILTQESMKDIGLYCISRVFGKNESFLYIGKTIHSFGSRLRSHEKQWLDSYRGTKYVRLGRIVKPARLSSAKMKQLINDAEKTLIFYMNNEDEHGLIANVVSTKTTKPNEDLLIKNTGFRGMLPKKVYIPAKYNVD